MMSADLKRQLGIEEEYGAPRSRTRTGTGVDAATHAQEEGAVALAVQVTLHSVLYGMAQSVFAFEQPVFRKLQRPRISIWLLIFGAATWLMLYAGIGWRFWTAGHSPVQLAGRQSAGICILLGVVVALGWRRAWSNLRRNLLAGPMAGARPGAAPRADAVVSLRPTLPIACFNARATGRQHSRH